MQTDSTESVFRDHGYSGSSPFKEVKLKSPSVPTRKVSTSDNACGGKKKKK